MFYQFFFIYFLLFLSNEFHFRVLVNSLALLNDGFFYYCFRVLPQTVTFTVLHFYPNKMGIKAGRPVSSYSHFGHSNFNTVALALLSLSFSVYPFPHTLRHGGVNRPHHLHHLPFRRGVVAGQASFHFLLSQVRLPQLPC